MARTVALVDQIDQHIANLTVRETLEFAYICQVRKPCSACCPADAPLISHLGHAKGALSRCCRESTSTPSAMLSLYTMNDCGRRSCACCAPHGGLLGLWRQAGKGKAITACIMRSKMCTCAQNGYNPKDLFDPVEELHKARAANGGKWEDEHTKTEAVLDTALQVHDKDSANLEDGCNVSPRLTLAGAPHLHCSCPFLDDCAPAMHW